MIHFGGRFGVVLSIPDAFLKLWDWRPRHARELFRLLLRSILEILAIRQKR